MPISPREAAQIRGKEPIFAVVFVLIVALICYGVFVTLPGYNAEVAAQNKKIENEIREREKSKALEKYQQQFDRSYKNFETEISNLSIQAIPAVMDEIRRLVKTRNLEILDLSRSTKASSNLIILGKNLEVDVIEVNLTVSGNINDAIAFMNDFTSKGPYRRIAQLAVSALGADGNPKYTMVLMAPAR